MSHHKIALLAYAAMGGVTAWLGVIFAAVSHIAATTGLYWAIITVTTIGYGDVVPHTPHARLVAVSLALTGIPLYSLTVALFTSWLMAGHIRKARDDIKEHVSSQLPKGTT